MKLRVLQTLEHPCGYYPDRLSQNLIVDPDADGQQHIYNSMAVAGFRRAGDVIFRPHCKACQACTPCRVNVFRFQANRQQQRCLKKNNDLDIIERPARYSEQHFQLYQSYLAARHRGGSMDNPEREDFERFLLSQWADTWFIDLMHNGTLIATAVTDRLDGGLSAVYCFFSPQYQKRSLGVMAVLTQLKIAREMRLPWLYLGYWIDQHPKMHYKQNYRPIEIFKHGNWQAMDDLT